MATGCRRIYASDERPSGEANAVTIAKPIAVDESLTSSQGVADNKTFAGDETFTGDEGRAGYVACEDEDALGQ